MVLPDPLRPTMPNVCPIGTSKETLSSAGDVAPRYLNRTLANSTWPDSGERTPRSPFALLFRLIDQLGDHS